MYVLVTIKVYFELFELNIEYLFPLSGVWSLHFFSKQFNFQFRFEFYYTGYIKKKSRTLYVFITV